MSYSPPSHTELKNSLGEIRRMITKFCNKFGFCETSFSVSEHLIVETLIQANKQMATYNYFYGFVPDEFKEVAAIACEIVKYKPLARKVIQNGKDLYTVDRYNELFAIFCITTILRNVAHQNNKPFIGYSHELTKFLWYSLYHKPVSYDSLAFTVSAMGDNYR